MNKHKTNYKNKLCKTCGVKPVAFSYKKYGRDYFRSECSGCLSKKYNKKNPINRKVINDRYHKQYKIENANWKEQMMEHIGQHCCKHCGESHLATLSFHHRNLAEKSFKLSWAYTHYYSLESMKKEAEKCDLVCANCHQKLHATNPTGRNWTIKQSILNTINQHNCSVCGDNDIRVLSFHHPDDNKLFSICKNIFCFDLDILIAEATKCEILCENCHRKEHHATIL